MVSNALSDAGLPLSARQGGVFVRAAKLPDAANIFQLVSSLSHDGTLLPRSYAEICENVRDFAVAETVERELLGCGALHLYGPHLAEVRSIMVRPEAKGLGAGGRCCDRCWRMPQTRKSAVSACSRESLSSSFTMASELLKGLHFRTRSTRIARPVRGCMRATKWRWCVENYRESQCWDLLRSRDRYW